MSFPVQYPDCRPDDHPEHLLWPPELPDPYPYPPVDSKTNESVTSQAAFNEDIAREKFGGEYMDDLKKNQDNLRTNPDSFKGDWLQLAYLRRCHETSVEERIIKKSGAEICGCPFCRIEWTQIHLENAKLSKAHLEYAKLYGAHLENAILYGVHLENADLSEAHLENAFLSEAHLENAKLSEAHLENAFLSEAHLENAKLYEAHLENAILSGTHLNGAGLAKSYFDGADVRGAKGIIFDSTEVDRMRIEGNAPDPWSVLRRSYTGPWFFFHLLMLIVFMLPYAGKAVFLSWESEAFRQFDLLHENLESKVESSEQPKIAARQEFMEHPGKDTSWEYVKQIINEQKHQSFEAFVQKAQAKRKTFKDVPAIFVLLGITKLQAEGIVALVFSLVLVFYNVLRAALTLKVSTLRDAEERSKITPGRDEYLGKPGLEYDSKTGWAFLEGYKVATKLWWEDFGKWRKKHVFLNVNHLHLLIGSFALVLLCFLVVPPFFLILGIMVVCFLFWKYFQIPLNFFDYFGLYRIHLVAEKLMYAGYFIFLLRAAWWITETTIPIM